MQPGGTIFGDNTATLINGTMYVFALHTELHVEQYRALFRFVLITDTNLTVTPFNISLLNAHVVAGPAVYQAG